MAFTKPRASQVNFDTTNISDSLIRINSGETEANTKDMGLIFERGSSTNAALIWDESETTFKLVSTTSDASETTSNINISGYNNLQVGAIVATSIEVAGDILPDGDNTRSLGSSSLQWKDVYVGPGSLYVNGKKVLEETGGTIIVSADPDQGLTVKTTGSGVLTLQSGTTINIASTLQIQSGNSITDSAGTAVAFGDPLNMNSNKITNLGSPIASTDAASKAYVDTTVSGYLPLTGGTISSNLTVSGNFTVNGTTTTLNTATLSVADNLIDLNSDVTTGDPTQNAGIRILRGDSNAVQLRWNEANDKWELTTDGSAYANIAVTGDIPTVVSSLTNDSGFISGYSVTQSDVTAHQAALTITESQISNLGTYLTASDITGKLNLSGGTMSGDIAMGTSKITGMGNPTLAQDAATKAYVDSVASSISSNINMVGDTGSDVYTTGGSLQFIGGTGISSTVSDNAVSYAIDTTVATVAGVQTLSNKTLTSPIISSISNTGILTLPTATGTIALTSNITLGALGVVASDAELNILNGASVSTTEINYVTGVTSSIQSQLDSKLNSFTETNDLSASVTWINVPDANITQSSVIQHQAALAITESQISDYSIATKLPLAGGTMSGHIVMDSNRVTGLADPVGEQDAATKAYVDANAGSGGGSSGFVKSTFTSAPGADGNYDLSYNNAQTTQETPFTAGGADAFGVNLGEVYDMMEPVGSISTVDMGVLV